jgi:hypothetical protein
VDTKSLAGWDALSAAIATARGELSAAAPDAATAAESESYLMRVMAGCLDDAFLSHLRTENGLTRALPTKGGPNPDYLMWHAGIDPMQCYRLEGRLNDSERAGVGVYSFSSSGAALLVDYVAFDRATTDVDGCFSVTLGTDADTGVGALRLTAACRVVLVRVLHRVSHGQVCTLTFEREDRAQAQGASQARSHPAGAQLAPSIEHALVRAGQATLRAVRQFLEWSRHTSTTPNSFTTPPPDLAAEVSGDPDTTYGLGYYQLHGNEWLEVLIPAGLSSYWSLHTYNHWCESLPGAGVHDLNAVSDSDGQVRVRIGTAVPPCLANRVDTLGRERGVLIFRAIKAGATPLPEAQLRR